VGGTNTGTTVLDGLVGDGELSEVVSNHLGLDLDLVEGLSVVDTDDGTDHLGDDDHVTEVGLDDGGLLKGGGVLLGLTELLDQTHGLALKTTLETSAGTGVDQVHQLLGGKIQELVKVNSAVRELAEGSLLLHIDGSIIVVFVSLYEEKIHTRENIHEFSLSLVKTWRGSEVERPKGPLKESGNPVEKASPTLQVATLCVR